MKSSDFFIKFEIEPIVKLSCASVKCKNHITGVNGYCNLKYIEIDQNGKCSQFTPKKMTGDKK